MEVFYDVVDKKKNFLKCSWNKPHCNTLGHYEITHHLNSSFILNFMKLLMDLFLPLINLKNKTPSFVHLRKWTLSVLYIYVNTTYICISNVTNTQTLIYSLAIMNSSSLGRSNACFSEPSCISDSFFFIVVVDPQCFSQVLNG